MCMQCPNCGGRSLRVSVIFTGTVDIEVSDDGEFEVTDSQPADSEWDDRSDVYCYSCQQYTTVEKAEKAFEKGESE